MSFATSRRNRQLTCDHLCSEEVEGIEKQIEKHAMELDTARGNFQIAMVVHLASGIDRMGEFSRDIVSVFCS